MKAQEPDPNPDNKIFEIEELVTIPKTPEAAAFAEYANSASISHYTGKANIAIPIDGLAGRRMTQPISLTYQTGGIRVQQEAGVLGLGWNLNAGGMITRNVNGLPDDYNDADWRYYPYYSDKNFRGLTVFEYFHEYGIKNYANPQEEATGFVDAYAHFRESLINLGELELQPDTYSFSAGNLSGTLYIQYKKVLIVEEDEDPDDDIPPTCEGAECELLRTENNPEGDAKVAVIQPIAYCIEHPELKIDVTMGAADGHGIKPILGWTITDTQGTTYEFDYVEKTRIRSDGSFRNSSNGRIYNSGWYLTRISNAYQLRNTYDFNYSVENITGEYSMAGFGDFIADRIGTGDSRDQACGIGGGVQENGSVYYEYTKRYLESIDVNGHERVDFIYGSEVGQSRQDLLGQDHMMGMTIKNILGETVNEIRFEQSYFGPDTYQDEYQSRLRLDKVHIHGHTVGTDPQTYSLEYDQQPMPPRNSHGQDYWGFYNGMPDNQGLIPSKTGYSNPLNGVGDRNPRLSYMTAGILKSVKYPTGGYTRFDYGTNIIPETRPVTYIQEIFNESLDGAEPDANSPVCEGDPMGNTSLQAFVIEDDDHYQVDITITDQNPSHVFQAVAFRKQSTTVCDAFTTTAFDFYRSGNLENQTVNSVWLTKGKYTLVMMNDRENSVLTAKLSREVTANQTISRSVGGLRVVSKEDLDEDENPVKKLNYLYYDVTGSQANSSGILHNDVRFEEIAYRESENPDSPGTVINCEFLNRYASNRLTGTPNIVTYSKVSEVQTDINDRGNGAMVYTFYNENEGVDRGPYIKKAVLNGMMQIRSIHTIDDEGNYDKVAEEENIYEMQIVYDSLDGKYNPVYGMYFVPSADRKYRDILIQDMSNDLEHFMVVETGSPDVCVNEDFNGNTINECFNAYSGLIPYHTQYNYYVHRRWTQLISSTTRQYEGLQEVATTTAYAYDPLDNLGQYNVKLVNTEYANGRTEGIAYQYATDVGLTVLLTQHRTAEPITIQRLLGGKVQSTKKYNYRSDDGLLSSIELYHDTPDNQGSEVRLQILEYDPLGNIRKMRGADGLLQHLVWGYDYNLLTLRAIGENENAIWSAIAANPPDTDGGYAYSDVRHDVFKSIPGSLFTTFEYDPGLGLTRTTDPNGWSIEYQYDKYGRLHRVIDEDGNILSQNEYNLVDQTTN